MGCYRDYICIYAIGPWMRDGLNSLYFCFQIIRPTLSKWKESNHLKTVAAGEFHALYLTQGGLLYTCGNNEVGQLGRGTHNGDCKTPGNY